MTIAAGAIIARFAHTAVGELLYPPTREYFFYEGDSPKWSQDSKQAFFFRSYDEAEELARKLHAFALVRAGNPRLVRAECELPPAAPIAPVAPAPAAKPPKRAKPPRRAFDRLDSIRRAAERSKRKVAAVTPADEQFWWRQGAYG